MELVFKIAQPSYVLIVYRVLVSNGTGAYRNTNTPQIRTLLYLYRVYSLSGVVRRDGMNVTSKATVVS